MPENLPEVQLLQEYADSRGQAVRIDPREGVLIGVKLIGLNSRNGRRYREAALVQGAALYEGAKVNVNHPKTGPLEPRDYQDRLGVIRAVEFRPGEGLFGNLHFNPKHALAEQLLWDAEHNPRNVGFSHNVQAQVSRIDSEVIVEAITRVQSVDLVADPAATEGLFEQLADHTECSGTWDALTLDALTLDTLRTHRPDLLEEIETATESQARVQQEQLQARLAVLERGRIVSELLCKYGLPVPARLGLSQEQEPALGGIVNAAFVETLIALPTEAEVERRIAERAELVREVAQWQGRFRELRGPKSRDQFSVIESQGSASESAREFAGSLKR